MRLPVSVNELSAQAIASYLKGMKSFVEKLPPGTFNIVEILPGTLKVQLKVFLDDSELFKELQSFSVNWNKLLIDSERNPRIQRGWIFEFVWDDELLQLLLQAKSQGVKHIVPDKVNSIKPFKFCHQHELWVGIPINILKKGLPVKGSDWNLAYHNQWHWVANAEKLITGWFNLAKRDALLADTMAKALPWQKMPHYLENLGLKEEFCELIDSKLGAITLSKTSYYCAWKKENWSHPADDWLNFFESFPDQEAFRSILGDQLFLKMAAASLVIDELKEVAAKKERDTSRASAIEDARSRLDTKAWTKAQLADLAKSFKVEIKKSDSKPKLIAALLDGEKGQKIAEDIIGIPQD